MEDHLLVWLARDPIGTVHTIAGLCIAYGILIGLTVGLVKKPSAGDGE